MSVKRWSVLIFIWMLMNVADVLGMYAREFGVVLVPVSFMPWISPAIRSTSIADLVLLVTFVLVAMRGSRSALMTALGTSGYIIAGGCLIVMAKLAMENHLAGGQTEQPNLVGWVVGTLLFAVLGWAALVISFKPAKIRAELVTEDGQ